MDDLNLILQALAVGAAAGFQQTAGAAIKDAYDGLKTLVQHKFDNHANAQTALSEYEDDPDTYEKPLRKALSTSHLDQDGDILAAARQVLQLTQPQQVGMGKYTIQNTGTVQGQIAENNGEVTMNFGETPKG